MRNNFVLLLFLFVFSCVETNKPEKTIIIDKSTGKTAKKPNLDSFFEQILEEMPENTSIKNQEFTSIQSKKALRVAVILPVTGAYSKIGADSLDMVSFLEKKMGEKLQVKVFDTESKKTSIKKISDQINTIDFDVIVGPIFNFETVELASLQPLPIISLSNDKEINKKNVIVFGQNQDDQIKDTITFFAQQDKGNFMALFPNSPNGSRLYKVFKRSMEANKSEIMRVEFYDEDGISDVSRYVNKVINGLVQKTYTSKSDGKIVPERMVNEVLAKNTNASAETLFEIQEKRADVIYISANQTFLPKILNILNQPSNKQKLKDIFIVVGDFESLDTKNLTKYPNIFFYSNNFYKSKSLNDEFLIQMGYSPSKLAILLNDAISYSVYVNNNIYDSLSVENLKSGFKKFEGANGEMYFKGNVVRRFGKIMVIKNGFPVEVEVSGSGVSKISYITKTLDWKTSESIQNKDLPDELD